MLSANTVSVWRHFGNMFAVTLRDSHKITNSYHILDWHGLHTPIERIEHRPVTDFICFNFLFRHFGFDFLFQFFLFQLSISIFCFDLFGGFRKIEFHIYIFCFDFWVSKVCVFEISKQTWNKSLVSIINFTDQNSSWKNCQTTTKLTSAARADLQWSPHNSHKNTRKL